MYCTNCGAERENAKFCTKCGGPLQESNSTRQADPMTQRLDEATITSLMEPTALVSTAQAVPVPADAAAPAQFPSAAPHMASNTNVTVNVAGPQIIYQDKTGHSLLVRGLWFVFFGWWLGQIWLFLAWLLNLTVLGLPLGLMMINRLPQVMTLKVRSAQLELTTNADGSYALTRKHIDQRPFWLRAVYFVFVGCWASLLWAETAYLLGLLIITLPVSFMMFDRVPAVTTLARY